MQNRKLGWVAGFVSRRRPITTASPDPVFTLALAPSRNLKPTRPVMRPLFSLLALSVSLANCDTPKTSLPVTEAPKTALPITDGPMTAPPAAADLALFARANNAFDIDLYGKLRARKGNLALSPMSVSTALTMTWAGARGDTAAQMATVLHAQST